MADLPAVGRRTLRVAFERVLAERPDAVAHADEHTQITFADAWTRSLRIAAGVATEGVGRQQPVALLLDNSLDAIHAWTGVGLGGQVEVPVNTAYKGLFLSHVLNDSGAQLIVVEDHYVERIAAVADDLTALRTVVVRGDLAAADALTTRFRVLSLDELRSGAPAAPAEIEAGDLMAYMYTSGTTGLSKGVLVSHAHAYTYATREHRDRPVDTDRMLVALPLFHLAGQWFGVYQTIIHGIYCYVSTGFSASQFWDTIRAQRATTTVLLGAMAELLQQQPPRPDDADNPLDYAAMAPLPSNLARFTERFGVRALPVYGMSEIGLVLEGTPGTAVPGEAGRPRAGYELRVADPSGAEVATGEIGELWVRPEDPRIVLAGYHNLPGKTAETVVDGWVHTGDAFRVDAEGRFYFADRMKDALRRRGENVSSFEVEAVINEYPAVYESAVVGVPSDIGEDEIKAVIVLRAGERADPVKRTEFLVDKLPYFMVPRYLEFVTELPRTPTQKVRKHVLRDEGAGIDVWDREAAGMVLRRSDR